MTNVTIGIDRAKGEDTTVIQMLVICQRCAMRVFLTMKGFEAELKKHFSVDCVAQTPPTPMFEKSELELCAMDMPTSRIFAMDLAPPMSFATAAALAGIRSRSRGYGVVEAVDTRHLKGHVADQVFIDEPLDLLVLDEAQHITAETIKALAKETKPMSFIQDWMESPVKATKTQKRKAAKPHQPQCKGCNAKNALEASRCYRCGGKVR